MALLLTVAACAACLWLGDELRRAPLLDEQLRPVPDDADDAPSIYGALLYALEREGMERLAYEEDAARSRERDTTP